jgi:protein kinase C substrate 80K-H
LLTSPALYLSLLTHRLALTRLRSKTSRLESELETLHGILDDLAKGYNPNYQDMAVKAAVVGWEELSGKVIPDGEQTEGTSESQTADEEEEITDKELEDLEKKDMEGLLLLDGVSDLEGDEGEGIRK